MEFFRKLKQSFSPKIKEDPFFGPLRYQKAGFWEAEKLFTPESRAYEIAIDGGPDRPTETQRLFYAELEQRYPTLKAEISADLLEQLRNWREEFTHEDVWQQFRLESFSIPDLDAGQNEWELVYELQNDGHLFCVMMTGWKVGGIRIDG